MEKNKESNIVFINSKDNYRIQMNRLIGCLNKRKNCVIKTRGKAIYNAINLVGFATKQNNKIRVKKVKIGSEIFHTPEGKDINIPEIEISLEMS